MLYSQEKNLEMRNLVSGSGWRNLLLSLVVCAAAAGPCSGQNSSAPTIPAKIATWDPGKLGETLLRDPVWVYNNWSSYDELSDNIPLTEELAMKELDELIRLQKVGAHFDYYMMDAFWFAPDGGLSEVAHAELAEWAWGRGRYERERVSHGHRSGRGFW